MGLRDRLKQLVRPTVPMAAPREATPSERPRIAPTMAWPAPMPVDASALAGATVIELTAAPRVGGALRPSRAELGRIRPEGRVVVVADAPDEAAGVAERLTARLGRPVGWVA